METEFPAQLGAPAQITMEKLVSWADHPDEGVKYFSGTATYEKEFQVSPDQLAPGKR